MFFHEMFAKNFLFSGWLCHFYYHEKRSVHYTLHCNRNLSAKYFAFLFSSAFMKHTVFLILDNIAIAKKLLKVNRDSFLCFR